MIMRWPYLKVLMFSGVYFVPKRRPKILTTFWTCVAGRSFQARRRRRVEWMARPEPQGRRIRSVAVARLGLNCLKLKKETTPDLV